MTANKTVIDFNDYPDIDLTEFDEWFNNKFIEKLNPTCTGKDSLDFYKGKYDVEWWFHRDMENNQFSIELKLVDITNIIPDNPRLMKQCEEIIQQVKKK